MTLTLNSRGSVALAIALTFLIPNSCQGISPLSSIPTHHGINLDRLHLNERGGAVATRKYSWKQYQPRNTLPHGELGTSSSTTSSVVASYGLAPVLKDDQTESSTKTDVPTTDQKRLGQQDGLTPTAIACE